RRTSPQGRTVRRAAGGKTAGSYQGMASAMLANPRSLTHPSGCRPARIVIGLLWPAAFYMGFRTFMRAPAPDTISKPALAPNPSTPTVFAQKSHRVRHAGSE